MITATGLGSGLDISGLVTQLVESERAGYDLQLDRKSANLNAEFSALGSLKGVLSSFQSTLGNLNTLSNFSKKTVSSSDFSSLSATAESDAVPNNYSVDVTQLASSHSLASTAFSDLDETELGTGTLTIRFGTTDYTTGSDTYNSFSLNPDTSTATIDIDSSNNTLDGIMTAINNAEIGVKASIVNDGTGFRLLMTSESTGEASSLEISVSDDDGNNTDAAGLSNFTFNSASTNLIQTTAAQDAEFTVNGLSVSSGSNTVDSAIPGVTLSLKEVSDGVVNLSVNEDFGAVISGVNSFIEGYNQFINTVNQLSSYDAENDIPAALVGDFTLRSINGQIDSVLRSSISGLSGSIGHLSEIGITTGSGGVLELNSSKLTEALNSNPGDVAQLFSAVGTPSDSTVQFKEASSKTVVGSYAVEITTLASSGFFESASVLPNFGGGGTLVIDADNDNLSVEIDGVDSGEITLTNATYSSGEALAAELQTQINGTDALRESKKTVSVVYDSGNNRFSITSNTIGSTSTVNVSAVDINTATSLGFDIASGTEGNDVAGTIGGVAATGAGNLLIAADGSDAEGLRLEITGSATGSRGEVNFTRGISNQLNLLMTQLLDTEGALEDRIDSYQGRIDALEERRAELELKWELVTDRYTRQFNALDSLLASLQSTSEYMEEQFQNFLTPDTGQ